MDGNPLLGLLFGSIGLFTLAAVACDWEWFFTNRRARFFTWLLGRTGARLFYGALGIGFVVLGGGVATGAIELKNKCDQPQEPRVVRDDGTRGADPTKTPTRRVQREDTNATDRLPRVTGPEAEPGPSGETVTLWNARAEPSSREFSVQYRFDRGQPQPGASYCWVIEGETGSVEFDYRGHRLDQKGALEGRVLGGEVVGKLRTYLAERQVRGERERVSNIATVYVERKRTVAKPRPSTPPPRTKPPAEQLADALRLLKSSQTLQRTRGADSLARLKPDPSRRKEVAEKLVALLADRNMLVRTAAIKALAVWHTPESIPAILPMVTDSWSTVRRVAFDILAETKEARAAEAVARCLTSATDRRDAARALAKMGAVAEKPLLPYAAGKDRDVRLDAIRVLDGIGGEASYRVLAPLTRDDDILLRAAASQAVRNIRTRHPDLPPLEEILPPVDHVAEALAKLGSNSGSDRSTASRKLAQMAPVAERREEVAAALAVLLADEQWPIRREALVALAAWHTEATFAAVAKALDDENNSVRATAFDALAKIATPQAAQAIASHIEADRFRAFGALRKIGPPAEDVVLTLVESPDRQVRIDAIRLLGQIGTEEKSIPVLRKLLKHSDVIIRSSAKMAGRAILKRADEGGR